jgi:hypothetical protein
MDNTNYILAKKYYDNGLYKKSLDLLQNNIIINNILNLDVIDLICDIYLIFYSFHEAYKYMKIILNVEPILYNYTKMFFIIKKINDIDLIEDFLNNIPNDNQYNQLKEDIKYYLPNYFDEIYKSLLLDKNKLKSYLIHSYKFKIKEYSILINQNYHSILSHPKKEFRYFCYNYLDIIRQINIPQLPLNSNNETVLIEFRQLPHLEFLIRNTILKLDNMWSHTVVCGNLNYEYMVDLCSKISSQIKIIKLNYDNLTPNEYSKLLSTVNFWELFIGEKILIYQEDTFIFKSNINDFLSWDYIGAPWHPSDNINNNNVGNGGFSLRTKKYMIDVINYISIYDVNYNKKYNDVPPEDVYFSKVMIDYNIGKVSDFNSALAFSHEYYINENAFGSHCFFLYNINWKDMIYNVLLEYLI